MAKDKDNFEPEQQYTLEEILAEFGNESRDLPRETHPDDQMGVPEEGPDLIPVPEHPHEEPPADEEPAGADDAGEPQADWRENTIPFPVRPQRAVEGEDYTAPAPPPPEEEPEEEEAEEPTRLLEFPSPEPESPVMAGLGQLRRRADSFASHMYEEEDDKKKAARARRAEKLIPGVDREETPAKPVRERRPRRETPPPPDTPAAELAKRYSKGLKSLRARTILCFLLALVTLYLTLAGPLGLPALTGDAALNLYVIASFHIIALVLCYDAVAGAVTAPFKGGMGMDLVVVLGNLFALADTLTIPTFGAAALRQSFCGPACLALWGVMLGNLQKQRGQRLCCRAAAAASSPYLVTRDEGKWNGRDTYIKWSGQAAGFGSQVQAPDGAQRIYKVMAPLLLLAALLFALISSVGRGRTGDLLWCLAAILTAAAPISATLAFGGPWKKLSVRLTRSGAALAGWRGVTNTTGSANLILTDTDLFPNGSVTLNGVKVFGDFPIDKVVADAATLIRDSGCGLENLFDQLLRQQGSTYRRGENFTFYEGGGVSETIRGEQVLVGSAAFMVLMEVPLPTGLKVKNAVFCAIDGELAGIFALHYELPGAVPDAIDSLIRNRITPVLATRDFSLIPANLRQKFKLPSDKMEYPAVDRRRALSDPDQEHSDTLTAVLCREGLGPYAEAVVGGRRLRSGVRLAASLCCLGSAVGALLSFYLTFVAAYASLTPGSLLIFLLAWAIPTPLITGWVDQY